MILDKAILKNGENLALVSFVILLLSSFIYSIPELGVSYELTYKVRYFLYTFSMLMLFLCVSPQKIFGDILPIAFLLLAVSIIFSSIFHHELYISEVSRLLYIMFLISFIRSQRFYFLDALSEKINLVLLTVFIYTLLALILFFSIDSIFVTGVGNGRGNFSIWLVQIIFLQLILAHKKIAKKNYPFAVVFFTLPIVYAQILSGGRIGLLASLSLILCSVYLQSRFIGLFKLIGLSLLIVWVGYSLNVKYCMPDGVIANECSRPITRDIFRFNSNKEISLPPQNYAYFDRLSGHRLDLMLTYVSRIDKETILFGTKVENRIVNHAGAGHVEPHNLFLNIFLSWGVISLALACLIVFYPFLFFSPMPAFYKYYLSVCIFISMLQPNFLITQLSGCLLFWATYSVCLKTEKCFLPAIKKAY